MNPRARTRTVPILCLTLLWTPNILVGGSTSSELGNHGGSPSQPSGLASQDQELQEAAIPQDCEDLAQLGDLEESAAKESRATASSSPLVSKSPPTAQEDQPEQPVIYVGKVKLQATSVDSIAGAFLQSSRKTLHFVPPTKQNGEIVIRPTKEVVDSGSKKWQSTAVGYFLGRRPYFPQMESFARANWKGLQHVSATSSGFFFFRFCTRFAMEEVIEGGPWLFQGQPIVLQVWEQGMSLRRQQHTQIPVWIRLKHLPMEYWTDEGLSTVASGVGTPLYTDGITTECSRLDYARMHKLSVIGACGSNLPGYEEKELSSAITIFVQKSSGHKDPKQHDGNNRNAAPMPDSESAGPASVCHNSRDSVLDKGKELVLYNSYDALATELITEPEKTRVSFANVQRIRRNLLVNWSWFDDYSGPAGRIWLVWNPLEVGVDILRVDSQFIHCCAFNKRLHTRCLITVLYGDYDIIPRRNLWRALGDLSTDISDEPWLVLGDFNAVMDDSEVCGRAADTSISMTEFRTCVRDAGLVQLPSTGCPFTWHNCSEGPRSLWKRGDENAIFRFDNFLTRIPGFLNSVEEIWKHRIAGTAMYEIVCKLKLLKSDFRRQKKLKGNLTTNVMKAKAFLEKAQALFTNSREDIFLNLVKCCRRVYAVAVKLEISMLQQRAKLRWLKHGDHNSKVFFRKINASRVKQRVYQIKRVGGELLTAQNDVNQEFISYFQNLFGGPSLHRSLDLEFLRPELKHTITPAEASLLTAHVTRSEVKEAFFDIDVESAPGPDGYTSEFYRAAWSVVGQDLFKAVGEFFHTGKLLKQINTTLIALIPKVNMPLYVSDYRPISCCNVLYKAITKIIVKRIHRILPLMIDNSQTAFVPGRSITDNILLAQELLAGYNQMRLPNRCTLKVDIQKAYDSVEWDFLLEVLRLFNFPNQFIVLIDQCISTASFSVSINGSIHGFFKGGRGLRQGDPMSPYLFVLVMEIGNALLKYRVKQATDFQYHWKCKDSGLINLCFADDVLLFCKAHLPSIKVLTDTLNEFAAMSGLKVKAKSQIILSRSVQQERQQILDYLGFQEGTLPIKYLGIPLTSSRLTMSDCRPLIDKWKQD
ncbi:UNVERIFIED_CONTAM: hypothetical protein Sradi_7037500 [Sesamum radiatum]|uniref:Reverse transcriptase domain-containing protein n=1 Tax=Sesamum radiatum TaxID=300843 RepID=A0AAW2JBN6_SESRA